MHRGWFARPTPPKSGHFVPHERRSRALPNNPSGAVAAPAPVRGFWAPVRGGQWVKGAKGMQFVHARNEPGGWKESRKRLVFPKDSHRDNLSEAPAIANGLPAKPQPQHSKPTQGYVKPGGGINAKPGGINAKPTGLNGPLRLPAHGAAAALPYANGPPRAGGAIAGAGRRMGGAGGGGGAGAYAMAQRRPSHSLAPTAAPSVVAAAPDESACVIS